MQGLYYLAMLLGLVWLAGWSILPRPTFGVGDGGFSTCATTCRGG